MNKLKAIALSVLATVAFSCQRQGKIDLTKEGVVNGIDLYGFKDEMKFNERDANGKIILDTLHVVPTNGLGEEMPNGSTYNLLEGKKDPHLVYIKHLEKVKTP